MGFLYLLITMNLKMIILFLLVGPPVYIGIVIGISCLYRFFTRTMGRPGASQGEVRFVSIASPIIAGILSYMITIFSNVMIILRTPYEDIHLNPILVSGLYSASSVLIHHIIFSGHDWQRDPSRCDHCQRPAERY